MCQAAVGVVGDLGRNVGSKILPYCDEIMTVLLEGLIVRDIYIFLRLYYFFLLLSVVE